MNTDSFGRWLLYCVVVFLPLICYFFVMFILASCLVSCIIWSISGLIPLLRENCLGCSGLFNMTAAGQVLYSGVRLMFKKHCLVLRTPVNNVHHVIKYKPEEMIYSHCETSTLNVFLINKHTTCLRFLPS